MNNVYKKIKSILEYAIIFIIFFIGLRKGGYYKEDSLIGVYAIFLFSIIYFIVNWKNIKINKMVATSLGIFAISYFIPVILKNAATVSGALNIAIRVYSIYLLYIIIYNSENKEKYKKAIIIFTIIYSILALDEYSYRIFQAPLNFIGGGYIEQNNGRIGSIFQYSNLLGIMCVISIYLIKEKVKNDIKKSTIQNVLVNFLTIICFLTQSKMSMLLYIAMSIIMCIIDKKKENIFLVVLNTIYSVVVISLIESISVWIIIPAMLLTLSYSYASHTLEKNNIKYKKILNIVITAILVIITLLFINFKIESGIVNSISNYFRNFHSTKLRIVYYVDTLKLIIQSPLNVIFGLGGNAFRTMYETIQSRHYISLEVHSMFLQILLESGIIGLFSFLVAIVNIFKKCPDKKYKLLIAIVLIFAGFDVFFTYTFMMYILAIILAIPKLEEKNVNNIEKACNIVIFIGVFVITTMQCIAIFTEPVEVDNLNTNIEEQESIVKRCEIALKFDKYDVEYLKNYTRACSTYIEILEIKEELYGQDNSEKINDTINKIYSNTQNEIKYEKSNKYAIEDSVYYTYKYVDQLVAINYAQKEVQGYETYLAQMLENIEKLRQEHSLNDYAMSVYSSCINQLYNKYSYVNSILNSDKIQKDLNALKENEYISL